MRNLSLWQVSVKHLNTNVSFCSCYGHREDSKTSELYVCDSNLDVSNFDSIGNIKWSTNLLKLVPIKSSPINITYLSLIDSINVGLATGELISICDSGTSCNLVGICENGLLAMEWSPDQEALVLVTMDLKVIVMSCTFDPIKETNLLDANFGEKQFITVGWGKKETQFHGSEGKQGATAKKEEIEDTPNVFNNKVKISWRGDGVLFAVGYAVDTIRKFKIFDRDGNLQSTSEKVQGLESNLSWRPSGSLIATTQKLSQKYLVSFFEKNGLKHGEFDLPVPPTTVVENLIWSTDSEVLIVLCKDVETDCENLLLYTRNNYYWYLKQTLKFQAHQKINNILCESDFDAVNEKRIHVMLVNGLCYTYSWNWSIDHSTGKGSNDDALVAVIDGRKALITGFRKTVVPPPMSNIEIEFESYINSIHFISESSSKDTNSFLVSYANKLAIVEQTQKHPLKYTVTKILTIKDYTFPFQYYNWHWLNENTLLSVSINNDNSYSLSDFEINNDSLMKIDSILLQSPVTKIQNNPVCATSAFLELESGEILEYNYKSEYKIIPLGTSFPVPCPNFNVLSIDDELTYIGLSHKGILYMGHKMILNNVNSYFVHSQYLLITTLKHLLICAELTKSGIEALELYNKNESTSLIYQRKIERGSRLVIAVPNDTRTIFQMPRGNLETIQPRPLSLKIIGEYLNSLNYFEAFDLMRKQRINLNLIYDHNPKLFVSNVDTFLKSINNNSWLNLFLADLENVDVTKTMYASSYTNKKNDITALYSSKIQYICDIIWEHISKSVDRSERILPLLTTYVKKNTVNDLENALTIIKELKMEESNGTKLPVSSDEALKYLLYLVNVDNLFDVALGMYDFDLVLLVANKSQKDPKEYIPMLNELNEMDENYKRFSINKHLKRFDKAVKCLAKCGEQRYAHLRTFVKYHSLYKEALILFSPVDEIFKQISDDYGLYLKLKKQFLEAGLVYEKAGNNEKAIECYTDALEWELVFKLAKNKSREELDKLISDIVLMLKEEKRCREALIILEKYGINEKETILFAINCGQYKTAMRLCTEYNKQDLISTLLVPHLLEEYNNTLDLIKTSRCNFVQYRDRLFVVRENKSKKENDDYDSYGNRDMDLYSDAGSTIASSSGSGRSFRSSKNRRKHERKIASLKEGSQYEDTALVMALHALVASTFELRLPVREINVALCCGDRGGDAAALQSNLEELLKVMKDSFKQIWNNELVLEATKATIAAENIPAGTFVIPQGIASLAPHMRIEPHIQDIKWKLEDLH